MTYEQVSQRNTKQLSPKRKWLTPSSSRRRRQAQQIALYRYIAKEGSQVGSDGMDIFEAGEGATMQRNPMLRDDAGKGGGKRNEPKNVLGDRLEVCSLSPMTGFFRDGCCDTSREDIGSHTVCAVMTAGFLEYSKSCGNDLSTPVPEFGFPGLKPGDRWCLCAPRWQEALQAGRAPRVVLRATHEGALSFCSLADLKRLAVDLI
jgi:uncharacterized protein (DUF2237 family)